jgi:beta-glucosidase
MEVSDRTLRSVFLPPFEAAIRAGALSVMPAYHANNGIPSHASEYLLNDILRKEWGFKGFVVSDWGGMEMLIDPHRTAANMKEAVRQAVSAGVDMHMQGDGFTEPMLELVREGTIPVARLDDSVRRILRAKMQLGLFENRYIDPRLTARTLAAPEHVTAALKSARESIVLLENRDAILPLRKDYKTILVTGPNAGNNALLGDWSAPQPGDNVTTVLEGVRALAPQGTTVNYVESGIITEMSDAQIQAAVTAAKGADLVIAVVGGNDTRYDNDGNWARPREERTGGEGIDRADLEMVGRQRELVQQLHATGKPVVAVLINGRPLSEQWLYENCAAVIEAWEPGLAGGQAVAEILYGEINPSGKLAISIPRSAGHLPAYYNHLKSAEKDYKYSSWTPLYEFGYGLSYTNYEYSNLSVPKMLPIWTDLVVSVDVANTGAMAGEESVLLFVDDEVGSVSTPVKELKAFERIALKPGEKKTVKLRVNFAQLGLYNRAMKKVVEPGKFKVLVGGQAAEFEVGG